MTSTSAQITLRGLVGARWVLIALLAVGMAIMMLAPARTGVWLGASPHRATLGWFAALLAAWSTLNVLTLQRWGSPTRASSRVAGMHLLLDVVALGGLLALTGGASNPFTLLFFVPITLATLVSPRWTWGVSGCALTAFSLLFVFGPPPAHAHHFGGHLQGMWLAFGVSGLLVTHFVHRIALRLTDQREELRRLRDQALADRHFASLGTLAAGAAHELGTPLATLTILVGELPHWTASEVPSAQVAMLDALRRCKTIVERMATPELRIDAWAAGEQTWRVERLLDLDAPSGTQIELRIAAEARDRTSTQPLAALTQILRELLANAADASRTRPAATQPIEVDIDVRAWVLILVVRDHGIGMNDELQVSAFDPFLSTKPEGQGMGLGLYLVRAHVRQLGGSIELVSDPDIGTTVTVRVPLHPVPVPAP